MRERCVQGFGGETWGGKENLLEAPDVDGRIILKWIFGKWIGGMDWIDPAEDRVRYKAVVNAVMNLRVS
jgi:hypothetical protein